MRITVPILPAATADAHPHCIQEASRPLPLPRAFPLKFSMLCIIENHVFSTSREFKQSCRMAACDCRRIPPAATKPRNIAYPLRLANTPSIRFLWILFRHFCCTPRMIPISECAVSFETIPSIRHLASSLPHIIHNDNANNPQGFPKVVMNACMTLMSDALHPRGGAVCATD